MNSFTDSLSAPLLLIAMPQVVDPFFNRSVVLLVEHNSEGAFGVILNRPTEVSLERLLAPLDAMWGGSDDAVAWFGGPVQPQIGTVIFTGPVPAAASDAPVVELGDGVTLSQDARVVKELAPMPPEEFRLIVGYAGWGASQLDQEIDRNDWLVAPFTLELVLHTPPESMWTRALESIGVRADSLAFMMTPPGEDGGAAN